MEKLLITLIILSPFLVQTVTYAKPKPQAALRKSDSSALASMVSTFELVTLPDGTLSAEIQNVNGLKKPVVLKKIEEYTEFTRYAFENPFVGGPETHLLNLYVFEKIKPTLVESRESSIAEAEISDIRMDLIVLMDSVTKKTIKTKGAFFYQESLMAEGSVDNNSQIKIKDDLSTKIKNCKVQELKVIKNLLGSDKRSLDLEIKTAQSGKQVKQKLNVNLLNMKLTPIPKLDDESLDLDLDIEGEENETDSTNS